MNRPTRLTVLPGCRWFGLLSLALLAAATPAVSAVLDNVGYTRLAAQLGDAMPVGRGLTVTQVESSLPTDHDNNPLTPKVPAWRPDRSARGLAGQRVVLHETRPATAYSRHATAVARFLIGRQGMATSSTLEVRAVSDWLNDGGLRVSSMLAPLASGSRVFNHSWAASLRGGNTRVLRRVDWLADRDEVIAVAGVRNAPEKVNQPLLAAAFNIIVVGRSDGRHSHGTSRVDDTYDAGRTRPHLVAPLKTASAATPVVASAALLLAEVAGKPGLSTSDTVTVTRGGIELRDAGRAEVLRAVLMASADRKTDNSGYADIDDYRATLALRSANGLDVRFGAGQLNVYKAWQLLSAGEQESSNNRADRVAASGFDYMAALRNTPDGTGASYHLETGQAGEFNATLSWQLSFGGAAGDRFDASAVLHDLDLCLYRVLDGAERLVSASADTGDTTENLHLDLSPGLYRLEVRFKQAAGAAAHEKQDYGLAWQFLPAGAQ